MQKANGIMMAEKQNYPANYRQIHPHPIEYHVNTHSITHSIILVPHNHPRPATQNCSL